MLSLQTLPNALGELQRIAAKLRLFPALHQVVLPLPLIAPLLMTVIPIGPALFVLPPDDLLPGALLQILHQKQLARPLLVTTVLWPLHGVPCRPAPHRYRCCSCSRSLWLSAHELFLETAQSSRCCPGRPDDASDQPALKHFCWLPASECCLLCVPRRHEAELACWLICSVVTICWCCFGARPGGHLQCCSGLRPGGFLQSRGGCGSVWAVPNLAVHRQRVHEVHGC